MFISRLAFVIACILSIFLFFTNGSSAAQRYNEEIEYFGSQYFYEDPSDHHIRIWSDENDPTSYYIENNNEFPVFLGMAPIVEKYSGWDWKIIISGGLLGGITIQPGECIQQDASLSLKILNESKRLPPDNISPGRYRMILDLQLEAGGGHYSEDGKWVFPKGFLFTYEFEIQ